MDSTRFCGGEGGDEEPSQKRKVYLNKYEGVDHRSRHIFLEENIFNAYTEYQHINMFGIKSKAWISECKEVWSIHRHKMCIINCIHDV